jgi:CheY-like chemotaxis protein
MSRDLQVGKYVRLTVQDSGAGMSPEVRDRVFEPFFTTKGPEGAGLGLSVVHGIVKGHGGAIKVGSEPGRGSTFCVYFPAAPVRKADVTANAAAQVGGRGQHILYIDDEESLGFAMTRVLKRLGYRCTFFSDPALALEAFRKDPSQFDAVITDMTMPHLTGTEMVKHLREIHPTIPIALTSGSFNKGDSASESGRITVWISKPATIQELSASLVNLLKDSDRSENPPG